MNDTHSLLKRYCVLVKKYCISMSAYGIITNGTVIFPFVDLSVYSEARNWQWQWRKIYVN